MKAISIKNGKICVSDLTIPQPGPNSVVVKVKACGLCGSDVQKIKKLAYDKGTLNYILGHEVSGIIHLIKSTNIRGLSIGERVVIQPIIGCDKCDFCRTGNIQFCENSILIGKNCNGGFAEYVIVPQQSLHKLPERIDFDVACLVDGIAVGVHALSIAGLIEGKSVAIVGNGALGWILSILARYRDARKIVLFGKSDDDITYKEYYNSFDVVFEAVGRQNHETLNRCIDIVKIKGKIIVLGVYPANFLLSMKIRPLLYKEVILSGSNSFAVNNKINEFCEALKILDNHIDDFRKIIRHNIPLSQFENGIELFNDKKKSKALKIIFTPYD